MSANEDSYGTDYATTESQIPVQEDNKPVESGVDASTADSDAQLERDDKDAIDESNIVDGRTRQAQPQRGTYREPGDTEGLPVDE